MEETIQKKRGRKKASTNYFTEDTEKAIILYNNESDPTIRAKIFTDHIYFPFYKLVENIIHTFKFYYTDVDVIEDLKHELISLLLQEKIHYFDPTRGAKAYSYFGTIIKRHLIVYNAQNYKALQQKTSVDSLEYIATNPKQEIDGEQITLSQLLDAYIVLMEEKMQDLFPRQSDLQTADAILTLFKKRKTLDLFNKKALYIMIREMTGVDTLNITRVVAIMKEEFYSLYHDYADRYHIVTE